MLNRSFTGWATEYGDWVEEVSMDWLTQYGPASCGLFVSAWLVAYAGFNMGANAKLETDGQKAQIVTGSTAQPASFARPHSD